MSDRIIRAALIQATLSEDTSAPVEKIKTSMIDKHVALIEEAASKGAREIAFAATAATISVAAVFIPVAFVTGMVGNFLSEFGATVATAVLLSLVVALTLTPMLAARIPAAQEREHGSIYHRLEQGFEALERSYRRSLDWALQNRAATLGIAILSLLIALLFDAIADPLVGAFSDRLESRWGRRHPLLFASALPLPVFFYLTFAPPAGPSPLEPLRAEIDGQLTRFSHGSIVPKASTARLSWEKPSTRPGTHFFSPPSSSRCRTSGSA